MHHNCCSLSSLNYVLLAQGQVNNTSSVYCSDQPCHLNQRLTKERGNPQFADRVNQESASNDYMSEQGSPATYSWRSARLIKERGLSPRSSLKLSALGRVLLCLCEGYICTDDEWGVFSWWDPPTCDAHVWSKANHRWGASDPHSLWDGSDETWGLFGNKELQPQKGYPQFTFFPRLRSLGLLCWPMTHEVIPRIARRLILFCFRF